MRKCLVSCLVILSGIVTNKRRLKPRAEALPPRIYDETWWWRHYISGYSVYPDCPGNMTINGREVPKPIQLNRLTTLGRYQCKNNGNNFRIGYILCDPSKIAPEMVCPKGYFCVINGSSTSCEKHLDCEGVDEPFECKPGWPLYRYTIPRRRAFTNCSRYSNASNVPRRYYVAITSTQCHPEDSLLSYKGSIVEYLSTVLVSDNHDLQRHVWSRRHGLRLSDLSCNIRISKKEQNKLNYTASDFSFVWRKKLPAKINVFCDNTYTWSQFYILFYEKNRAQFSIVQESSNIVINITNIIDKVWLDPSAPFNCTVSIDGGLFVKATSMGVNGDMQPRLGTDTIQMEYNNTRNVMYTCTAIVYYYEQFPPDQVRFKLLYKENRQWSVRTTTTTVKSSTESTAESQVHRSSKTVDPTAVSMSILTGDNISVSANESKTTTTGVPEAVRISVYIGIVLLAIFVITSMACLFLTVREDTTDDEKKGELKRQSTKKSKEAEESRMSSVKAIRSEDDATIPQESRRPTGRLSEHTREPMRTRR